MLELLKDFILKALGLILPSLIRWFYKPEKLNSGLKIRVRGEGDGVTYDGGDTPKIRMWLVITNLTPFEIEVERIYGNVSYGSVFCDFSHMRRYIIPAAQEKELFVEFWLNEFQIRHLRMNLGKHETKLYFGAYVKSNIHSIELAREIGTNNIRFLNCSPLGQQT